MLWLSDLSVFSSLAASRSLILSSVISYAMPVTEAT